MDRRSFLLATLAAPFVPMPRRSVAAPIEAIAQFKNIQAARKRYWEIVIKDMPFRSDPEVVTDLTDFIFEQYRDHRV